MSDRPLGDDPDFEILEIIDLQHDDEAPRPAPPRAPAATGAFPAMRPGGPAEAVRPAAHPPASLGVAERRLAREDGARQVLKQLLPALDALESCVRERPDAETLEQAVRMALRQLWNVFRPFELERIEGDGMPFDPRLHEAAEITPSGRVPANTVLETLRVGYSMSGELVRPALVRVSVDDPAAGHTGGDDRK